MSSKLRTSLICLCFFLASLIVVPAIPSYAANATTASTPATELVGWWGYHGGWGWGWHPYWHFWHGPHYHYYGPHYYYWRVW